MFSAFFVKLSLWMVAAISLLASFTPLLRRRRDPRQPGERRVLCLYRDLPFHGGIPRCLLYLAQSIDRSRIDLRVASLAEPSQSMRDEFQKLSIFPHCLGDHGYRQPMRRLRQLAREQHIDLVVATTFKTYICAKWALRGTEIGVVFWVHAVRGVINGWLRRQLVRILGHNDPMLFVSDAVRNAHLPAGHNAPSAVIYNGVADLAGDPHNTPYGPEGRQALGLPDIGLVLAYVAEFVDCKDHPTAVHAMHELARRGIDAHLLLIGAGKNVHQVRALADAGPAANRIHFLGVRSDVRRILGVVDIYLHPGREEGFGLALVEAMLSGLPLAGAREGALIELIESGQTGMLFNPGDPRDLANCISFLGNDLTRARQMGAAAREVCLRKFDVSTFAENITAFLESCVTLAPQDQAPSLNPDPEAQTAGARL
jgi:glycosyltransferase involved in cell wall biosynthesis